MRYIVFIVFTMFLSCQHASKNENLHKIVIGNWFILYPEEDLLNKKQDSIYAVIQDSLTGLKCLKLIRFSENGVFNQIDSVNIKGNWTIKEENNLIVYDGGRGFGSFKSVFSGFKDGVLRLTEVVNMGGQRLKLIWHLKKIDEGYATKLFDDEYNRWRRRPDRIESDDELKERVFKMVEYYSTYFQLIADESSYFIPGRIILPVNFYRHGISLKKFDDQSKFASFFYTKEQAKMAYLFLEAAYDNAKLDIPEKKSYSAEYSLMLKEIAQNLEK